MSPATCPRWIALCLIAGMVVESGCTTTRLGSMPKMNLAWWKKGESDPATRHDDIAPPSTTLSPSANIVDDPTDSSAANRPTRKPYQVDGEIAATQTTPPAPKTFELSPQSPQSPPTTGALAQMPSVRTADNPMPLQKKLLGQLDRPNSPPAANTTGGGANSTYSPETSMTAGEEQSGFQTGSQITQSGSAQRFVNPFASGPNASTPTPPRVQIPQTNPNTSVPSANAMIAAEATTSGSVYTRTPYNAFAPKNAGVQTSATTPAAPLPSPTSPKPSTQAAPNSSPLTPMIPKTSTDASTSNSPPTASPTNSPSLTAPPTTKPLGSLPDAGKLNLGSPIQSPAASSSLPETLLKTQGSYTPGSVRTAQSLKMNLPSATPAPAETPSSTPTLPLTMPTLTTPPTTAPSVGGGGSFKFSK